MCKLMSTADMPTNTDKKNGTKKFIAWFPKPNNDGENTRVRLLWFLSPNKNNRDTPYFSQMIHDHWGVSSNGTKIVDDMVVCPSTKYASYNEAKWVKNPKTGKNECNCPICSKEREAMAVWKNSGWKDKTAMKRRFALMPKFRAYVPVYMINDPNNPKNNGHMKVMIFTNKEDFDLFDQVVKAEKAKADISAQNGKPYEIFNGRNGVDMYLHCETVEEVKKNGFTQRVRKMTGIAFDDPSSKYDINEITKERIESELPMDEQFFISNTKEEIEHFYRRYYAKDETVIPKENVDIFKKNKPVEMKKVEVPTQVQNPNPVNTEDDIDINDVSFNDDPPEPSPFEDSDEQVKTEEPEDDSDMMSEIEKDLESI